VLSLHFPKPQNADQQPQTNFLTKICDKTSIKKTASLFVFKENSLKCCPKDGKTTHQPAGKSLTERQRNKRGEKKSTALTWKKENDF
jgi:hypothetical protein